MGRRIFNNLSLLVAGFGFGVILAGTVASWEATPISFRVLFVVTLGFVLYICLSLATTSGEHTHDKEDYPNAHPNKTVVR